MIFWFFLQEHRWARCLDGQIWNNRSRTVHVKSMTFEGSIPTAFSYWPYVLLIVMAKLNLRGNWSFLMSVGHSELFEIKMESFLSIIWASVTRSIICLTARRILLHSVGAVDCVREWQGNQSEVHREGILEDVGSQKFCWEVCNLIEVGNHAKWSVTMFFRSSLLVS